MLAWLLRRLGLFVTGRPVLVLVVAGVLAVVSAISCSHLPLRPSRFDMVPKTDPAVLAWQTMNGDFGSVNTVFLVVEGAPDKIRRFADRAKSALDGMTQDLRGVTARLERERFEAQGLYVLEPARLQKIERDMIDLAPLVREVGQSPSAAGLITYMADEIGDEETPAKETREAINSMRFVRDAVRALKTRLDAKSPFPPKVFPSLALRPEGGKSLVVDDDGYLTGSSGTRLLVILSPAVELDSTAKTKALLERVHQRLDPITEPGVSWIPTGGPIRSIEEEATVRRDMKVTAVCATLGVLILCRMAFQGILPAVIIEMCLWLAIIYNGAVTKLMIGHLNLIGAVFVPLMLGLGEDFGNYLMMVYQDSDLPEGPDAMVSAMEKAGPGMIVGAITTATVFYSLTWHEFVAFQEMGLISGNGILLAMLCMLVLLPAAVVVRARVCHLQGKPKTVRFTERVPLSGRALLAISRPGRLIAVVTVALVVAAVLVTHKIEFDFNLTNMLASGATTVKYEQILHEEFGVSTEMAVICARTMDGVYRIHDQLSHRNTVGGIDSLATLVPRDVDKKKAQVLKIADWGKRLPRSTAAPTSSTPDQVDKALEALIKSLKRPYHLANLSESSDLRTLLDECRAEWEALRKQIARAGPRCADAFLSHAKAIQHELNGFVGFLENSANAVPFTLDTLPKSILQRFVSKSGRLATYVSPVVDLTAEENAKAFYLETTGLEKSAAGEGPRRDTIEVAGIPHIIYRMVLLVRSGFYRAAVFSLIACLLILVFDFRRLDLSLLALLPVICGMVWLVGLMAYNNLRWNPLDAIVIPLLPGIGIAYAVNIIHRVVAEDSMDVAMASTGRAALYSAYSTIVGFSSLVLANHRGLSSFGKVVVLGAVCCISASVTLLPVLLRRRLRK